MPIENYLALIKDPEWRKKSPTFEVDKEILEWVKLHRDIWLERWKKRERHWTENEERTNYIGLLGEKCFELTLQQIEVPYVRNDPLVDITNEYHKPYDFRVPFIETIEVKTVDFQSNQTRMLVKKAEYHNSDYYLAIKLLDQEPTKAMFMGYAAGEEVQNFTYAENEFPCRKEPCYWQFLEKLHSAREFFNLLREKTSSCWKR
jgi:hypothetical protein